MNFLKRFFQSSSPSNPRSVSQDGVNRLATSSNGGSEGSDGGAAAGLCTTPTHESSRKSRSKSASRNSTPTGSVTSLPGVVLRPAPCTRTREIRMSSNKNFALILPGLLLGSQEIALDLHGLQHYNVTHILNVTMEVPEKFPEKFAYRRVAISDLPSTKIVPHFEDAFRFIDKGRSLGGVVLVHCYYGNSRSASFIIGYLIKVERMRYSDALEYLRILRPDVNPNDGFQKQLKEYELSVFGG